jgi:hypothetical protein
MPAVRHTRCARLTLFRLDELMSRYAPDDEKRNRSPI